MDNSILILDGPQVQSILDGRERLIVDLIGRAYLAHRGGGSCLPHSSFINFPDRRRERIIALPAYLGGDFDTAGIKWIASFPENHRLGIDRASAAIILNSMQTGRPYAIMEGAAISATRTAASAALAATRMKPEGLTRPAVSLIGCGPINLEIARFLVAVEPGIDQFVLHDLDPAAAHRLADRLEALFPSITVRTVTSTRQALAESDIVSLATTAIDPHISGLDACRLNATILHISLRDLTAECILSCDNVTDDVDHVLRSNTSLHLAKKLTGSRDWVRCTLADILAGEAPNRAGVGRLSVFSPFGLGVLDLALAQWVANDAATREIGTRLPFFPPTPGIPVPEKETVAALAD